MLPESIICVLANRGPKVFANAFLSDVDNPEVIWKYAMRGQLIDMISQHLGELPARLRANPATIYDYCPIPRVQYEELDEELWCSNFYLRNLTDEQRFPEWNIDDPVMLLRAALDNWRLETNKTDEDKVDMTAAWKELGLEPGTEESDIRKAYRKLARKFHPDKNPAGRDRFMQIQRAYEALTTSRPEAAAGGPDPVALLLLVRTQCILFKRHTKVLKPYKYAGYPLVMQAIRQIPKDTPITGDSGPMAEALTRLIYLTCLTSPRNAEELVREDGTEALAELLGQLVKDVPFGTKALLPDKPLPKRGDELGLRVVENVMRTLSGLATLPEARERMTKMDTLMTNIVHCLRYLRAAKVMQYALEMVSRLAALPELQSKMVQAGALFRLVPLFFRFDTTLEGAATEGHTVANEQKAANHMAKLSVRAVGRLGGYLAHEKKMATPKNPRVQRMMRQMITPPLAKRLGRASPDSLLKSLVGHEESPTVMWNADMRKELLRFLKKHCDELSETGRTEADAATQFNHSALADELCIEGLFVRFFVSDPTLTLDNPHAFLRGLMAYIAMSRAGPRLKLPGIKKPKHGALQRQQAKSRGIVEGGAAAGGASGDSPAPKSEQEEFEEEMDQMCARTPADVSIPHLRLALRALHGVVVHNAGVEEEIGNPATARYLPNLMATLRLEDAQAAHNARQAATEFGKTGAGSGASAGMGGARSTAAEADAPLRELALACLAACASNERFAKTLAGMYLVPPLLRMLPAAPTGIGPLLRTLFSHQVIIAEARRVCSIIDVVTMFAGGIAKGPPR